MQRPWPYPRVVAHRGGGALAPENTLAGIRKAVATGFGGVEFDVMLSADKVPLLIHDETLERTTDGRGAVSATPSARLCVELGLWANVEIKPAQGFERETGAAAAKLALELWRGASPAPLLSSFQRTALKTARAAAPELDRGFLTDRIGPDWRDAAQALGCVSVHCNCKYLTPAHAKEIRGAGYWLLCYTANDPETVRRLFSWGVDAIFTDRLDLIPPDFS